MTETLAEPKQVACSARRVIALRYGPRGVSCEAKCAYCDHVGRIGWCGDYWISFYLLEIEHMNPIALGGTHRPENLTLACRKCNRAKRNRPLDEWMLMIDPTWPVSPRYAASVAP